jgi:hypothetical protein
MSTARFAVRRLFHTLSLDAFRTVYDAYFHSLIKYGIVFWGNSSNESKVFLFQKWVIRIIMGVG